MSAAVLIQSQFGENKSASTRSMSIFAINNSPKGTASSNDANVQMAIPSSHATLKCHDRRQNCTHWHGPRAQISPGAHKSRMRRGSARPCRRSRKAIRLPLERPRRSTHGSALKKRMKLRRRLRAICLVPKAQLILPLRIM